MGWLSLVHRVFRIVDKLEYSLKPLVKCIDYLDPMEILSALNKNDVIFFDSSMNSASLGRYSFIALDPFSTLQYRHDKVVFDGQPLEGVFVFEWLSKKMKAMPMEAHDELPPFQGGVAGLFSYDLVRSLEKLPHQAIDDKGYPDMVLGWYDLVIAFDQVEKKAFIFSSGLPEREGKQRLDRAEKRLKQCLQWIKYLNPLPLSKKTKVGKIVSNHSRESYIEAVNKAKNYIVEGDIFEVNLSQRFSAKISPDVDPLAIYDTLRSVNPAPFSGFARLGDTVIASSSPERFLKVEGRYVETRPIKGTMRRSRCLVEDAVLAQQLHASEKDRAENTMIVDLMRNDLSRVCKPYSINVPQLCKVEGFQTVHHLVSVVEGCLEDDKDPVDLLQACFPGGSITGAPKIRSMEIIDELEGSRRGPYCGSLGYLGFDGAMDTNILIRTLVFKGNEITFQAGGAVVLDSNPEEEYRETILKAEALVRSLTGEKVSHDLID